MRITLREVTCNLENRSVRLKINSINVQFYWYKQRALAHFYIHDGTWCHVKECFNVRPFLAVSVQSICLCFDARTTGCMRNEKCKSHVGRDDKRPRVCSKLCFEPWYLPIAQFPASVKINTDTMMRAHVHLHTVVQWKFSKEKNNLSLPPSPPLALSLSLWIYNKFYFNKWKLGERNVLDNLYNSGIRQIQLVSI